MFHVLSLSGIYTSLYLSLHLSLYYVYLSLSLYLYLYLRWYKGKERGLKTINWQYYKSDIREKKMK